MCIYICVYLYVFKSMCAYVCISICIHICIFLYIYTPLRVLISWETVLDFGNTEQEAISLGTLLLEASGTVV